MAHPDLVGVGEGKPEFKPYGGEVFSDGIYLPPDITARPLDEGKIVGYFQIIHHINLSLNYMELQCKKLDLRAVVDYHV